MRLGWKVAAVVAAAGALTTGISAGLVESDHMLSGAVPLVTRVVYLQAPTALLPNAGRFKAPIPAGVLRHWRTRDMALLARTFTPGSALYQQTLAIYRRVAPTVQTEQQIITRVQVAVTAAAVIGPYAHIHWTAKVWFKNASRHSASARWDVPRASYLNGERGAATLRKTRQGWRIVGLTESYIPGEGP